jgi:hypothetical protein
MSEFKIKGEFNESYIAFGKEPVKLGKKSQAELRDLAIMAVQSQDPTLLALFDGELPHVSEMIKARAADEEKRLEAMGRSTKKPATANEKQVTQPPRPTEQGGTSPKP